MNDSPITELVGLVQAVRLLEERISCCVAACREQGYGATEIGRVLGVHRATVYRFFSRGIGSVKGKRVGTD